MKKLLIITILGLFFSLTNSNAAVYKGQKIYIKKCRVCHSSGFDLASLKKKKEWDELMKRKGKPLSDIHLKSKNIKNDKDGKKIKKYFKSKKYFKKSRHLKDFLYEYAKDSGNVPACN